MNRWMDTEGVAHIYKGILLNHKKERNNAMCSNLDGPRDYHTKWSKPEKDKYHMISLIKKESEITQPCPILCDPMDCRLPDSSVYGIFQAKILEWVAISFSRGFSWPRDRTCVSHTAGSLFTIWATREVYITYMWNLKYDTNEFIYKTDS